ncbi:MAG: DUF6049 family protein, partial [Acidimicrobiales bacterium]
ALPRPGSAGAGVASAAVTPTIELVRQPAYVRPGEPYGVEVRVTDPPAGAQVAMVVHDRLQSRQQFRTTLTGELGGVEQAIDPQPLDALPRGPAGSVTVGFTPGPGGPGGSGRGVYPVEVQVRSPNGEAVAGLVTYLTFLTDRTPEFPPLQVGVLIDIGAPPSLQPDGSTDLPDGALDRARARARLLTQTQAAGVRVTLAPQPETIEALAASGGVGAATVDELRAASAGRRVIARPFVDVDLAALQRAGLLGEANHQAEDGADVVRERFNTEPVGGIWLSGPTLGAPAARLAVDLGFDRAVVPPSATADGAGTTGAEAEAETGGDRPPVPLTPVRLGADGPQVMVSDPTLAAHLTGQDGMVAAHRFIAELAITWLERPADTRAVLVHVPPDAPLDTDVAAAALGALADGQAAEVVPVEHIFRDVPPLDDAPTSIEPAPHDVDDRLGSIAASLDTARARVTGVGSALDDVQVGASLDHSLLLATGTETPDDQRAAYVDRVLGAAGELAQVVRLPDEFRITLTTRSSTIPVTLTNLSDDDLSVRVRLDGDQLEFPDGDRFDQVLAPGTTRIEVPVRVRTSGAFSLDVTVTSPDGTLVLDSTTFDVRSTAISGVGLVLSVGAGLFLAIWWARHWRRTRRSRHLMPPGSVGPGGPSGDGGEGGGGSPGGDGDAGAAGAGWPGGPDRPGQGVPSHASGSAVGATTPPPRPSAARAGGDDASYRPAHMARQRTRSG